MVEEWKILCTLLLVLVSTWTAVFARARVILQYLCYRISLFALSLWVFSDYTCVEYMKLKKSKLRLWAKHATEQIEYHNQFGKMFEFSIKRSGL